MTPDTTDYMILGYVVGMAILLITVGSVWWRWRSLEQDEATLAQLEKDLD